MAMLEERSRGDVPKCVVPNMRHAHGEWGLEVLKLGGEGGAAPSYRCALGLRGKSAVTVPIVAKRLLYWLDIESK